MCMVSHRTSKFQMVHVVSILEVPIIRGSASFQSKDVRGAQNSLVLFCAKCKPRPQAQHNTQKHKHTQYRCMHAGIRYVLDCQLFISIS